MKKRFTDEQIIGILREAEVRSGPTRLNSRTRFDKWMPARIKRPWV